MILQEYLVKLGWNIDEPSMKKFLGAIAGAGARTSELGATAVETAAAIELMVTRVARKYETLYYMSQRTGQSAKYIQGTQYAFKQIGLSAEEANHSIESMAATLRTQPWLKAIFGGASTPQAVASRLGKSGLPYFLQARFAEMIGMDEKTLLHLQKFQHIEAANREEMGRRQKEAGLDPEKLKEDSAAFGREVNRLSQAIEVFGDKMASNFIAPLTESARRMTSVVEWITRVDHATKGWLGTLLAIGGTAGGLIVVEKLMRRIFGMGAATATGGALAAAAGGGGFFKGKQASGIGKFLGMAVKKGYVKKGGAIGVGIGVLEMIKKDDPEIKGALRELFGIHVDEPGPGKKNRTSDRVQQAVEFFEKAGFPKDSAQGIAAGLYSESKMDPKSVNPTSGATGIAQWLGSRKADFKKMFLKDIGDATFEEQLQFVLHELQNSEKSTGGALMKGGLGGRGAARKFIEGFERPGAAGIESDMSRAGPLADQLSGLTNQQNGATGGKTVVINSKMTVNTGGGDPATNAREFGKAQKEGNDTLVRNVQGAMR